MSNGYTNNANDETNPESASVPDVFQLDPVAVWPAEGFLLARLACIALFVIGVVRYGSRSGVATWYTIFWVVSFFLFWIALYQFWKAVQMFHTQFGRLPSPGKVVFGCFAPILNLYCFFIAYCKLARLLDLACYGRPGLSWCGALALISAWCMAVSDAALMIVMALITFYYKSFRWPLFLELVCFIALLGTIIAGMVFMYCGSRIVWNAQRRS